MSLKPFTDGNMLHKETNEARRQCITKSLNYLFTDGNMLHKETDEARRQASRLSKIGSTEEVESGDAEDGEAEEEEEAEAADEVK